MKYHNILKMACAAILSVSVVSCIDDESAYGGDVLPGLTVTVPGDAEMPVYN